MKAISYDYDYTTTQHWKISLTGPGNAVMCIGYTVHVQDWQTTHFRTCHHTLAIAIHSRFIDTAVGRELTDILGHFDVWCTRTKVLLSAVN